MSILESTSMDPTLNAHTMVVVTNEGPRPLNLLYDGTRFTLKPNVPQPIPYLAMVLWFGNPLTVDLDPDDPAKKHRTNERRRIAAKWGTGFEPWYASPEDHPDGPPTTKSFYEGLDPVEDYAVCQVLDRQVYKNPKLPKIRVETYDGQRVITLIDDPEGRYTTPTADDTSKNQIEKLQQQLEVQRQNQALILQAIGNIDPGVRDQIAAQVAVAPPDALLSDSGVPVWPANPANHPSAATPDIPTVEKAATPAAAPEPTLGNEGLTTAIEADPVPTKRAGKLPPK